MNPIDQLSAETVELIKQAFSKGAESISKAGITTGTGLVGYNLEAPAQNLFPVLSPLRNRVPRTKAPVGSLAAHWKAVTGINTAGLEASVAFGTRNSAITYAESDKAATYKSFGLDDTVQHEAVWLGRGFDDVRARSTLSTLQSTMIEEEKLILGGLSDTNTLGTAGTVTTAKTSANGGTWGGAINFVQVKCVALPLYGWLNSNTSDLTAQLGARHSAPSAKASRQLAATTDSVEVSIVPINGAVAYAWFVADKATNDATDAELLLAQITTVASAQFKGPATGNLALSALTVGTDTSGRSVAFDGVLPQILNINTTLTALSTYASGTLKKGTAGTDATNALVYEMINSTAAPTGTAMTTDGAGGIIELDVVLKALWDNARIGPSLILMHSQEALSVTKLIIASTGASYRVNLTDGNKDITGGLYVSGYLNKFTGTMTPGSPDVIPFMIHPYAAPGTMIIVSEKIPYPNSNVPSVLEMEMQQEYTDFEWAMTQRQYEHGVYANGVLKHRFPAGCALIRGIKAS